MRRGSRLITGFGGEEPFVDELLRSFRGRVADAREFALRHRTLLLAAANSVRRASPFDLGDGGAVTTCGAEDLIVHKAFAGRDKDWLDVRGIVTRQGRRLDQALIWTELLPLLELREDTTTESKLRALLDAS